MRVHAAGGVEEGGDGWVGGANELGGRDSVGGLLLALVEKVEEEAVKRTGGRPVADGCGVPRHFGVGGSGTIACYRGTSAAGRASLIWVSG